MGEKFELIDEFIELGDKKLYRIRALKNFADVKAGDIGGFIEKEGNLDQTGNAWVYGNAMVSGNARVSGNATVSGNAEITKQTHILQIGPIGSRDDFTTFFRTKEKQIYVKCGCFCGRIDEFEKAVKQTHSGTKHEKTYLLAVDLAKAQVELE